MKVLSYQIRKQLTYLASNQLVDFGYQMVYFEVYFQYSNKLANLMLRLATCLGLDIDPYVNLLWKAACFYSIRMQLNTINPFLTNIG